jgi:hypothetical protein
MNTLCMTNKTVMSSPFKLPNSKKFNNIQKKIRSIENRKKDSLVKTFDYIKQVAKEDLEFYSNLIKSDIDEVRQEMNDTKNGDIRSIVEVLNIREDDDSSFKDESDDNVQDDKLNDIFMN